MAFAIKKETSATFQIFSGDEPLGDSFTTEEEALKAMKALVTDDNPTTEEPDKEPAEKSHTDEPVDLEESDRHDLLAIKALGGGRIGGYALIFGDEDTKDLHEEFFTPGTRDYKAIFDKMGVLPFIVHHAGDDAVKSFVGGAIDILEEDEIGLWFEAKTKEFAAYQQYVAPLITEKMAFASSGTLPAAKRKIKKTGEITRWPIVEVSATWTPAEYRMLKHPITDIKSAFAELGVELPETDSFEDDSKDASPDGTKGAVKARLKALAAQELLRLELEQLY